MQTLARFEGIFCENDCDYLGKIMPQSTGKLANLFYAWCIHNAVALFND